MGFPLVRIDSLYNIARGGSPRPIKNFITEDPDGINWIKIGDATASGKYIYETKQKIIPEGIQRSRFVKKGDFILSNSMSFGRPYIMATSGCIHDGWLVLSPKDERIDQDFLYYILGSPFVFQQFDSLAAGSTVRNLNIDLVSGVKIPLLPIPEQKRIVAILEQAFADIERVRANTEQNRNNARALFESYLQQVFSQRGEGWPSEKFGKVCKFVRGPFGGALKKNIFKPKGFAVYEQQHAIYDQFTEVRYFIDNEKFIEMSRFELLSGDLIMSCSGTMGKIAIVPDGIKQGIINQALLKLTPEPQINRQFLKIWMQSPNFQTEIESLSQGAAIKNMASVKILKEINLPLPSIEEQENIVEIYNQIKLQTDNLSIVYENKIKALDELKKSILQKAFSGELTANTDQGAAA